ncbi:hypothetical protein BST20_18060 [Mycobacterium branderi]|uniref:DUF222 domain-containing protein n=2 Tax=Mycobacterium branderi TaxID=43348 RepID=A0A7I7WE18_9MYCO|nr:hypothetical protein BST20_18060 [Mycobacterium branderi]BBZ15207.1 hypothetical protein MBRA_54020 [Mycobacterium branderi]
MSQPRARLQRAARDAALPYPTNPDLQQCAVDAAIHLLCDTADLNTAGAEWRRIQQEEKRIRARVRPLAVMSVADKIFSERWVARATFVDRMRLRRWSGKTTSARRSQSVPAQRASR